MHVSIGKAAVLLGVSITTLRRWEGENFLSPSFRTAGGHRRYALQELEVRFSLASEPVKPVHALGYARVSTWDQA
jgi:putative resolvase